MFIMNNVGCGHQPFPDVAALIVVELGDLDDERILSVFGFP